MTVKRSVVLFLAVTLLPALCVAQEGKEPTWKPALAYGGAPSCPVHNGIRKFRSEVVSKGSVSAVIVGVTARAATAKTCKFEAELDISGAITRKILLPNPSKQSFAIVDFAPDASLVLIYSEKYLEYPNEKLRDIDVATVPVRGGAVRWINAWDVFGWRDCDAMVEPQGFAPDGSIILRVRPSVMQPPRRSNCVKDVGLYKTDLAKFVTRLPDETDVTRSGKTTEQASQACKTDPDIIGKCFTVHGRLSAWNGTPTMRIWRIGTKRILGVHDDIMPEYLTAHMDWSIEAYGDFEVCPFTKERAGEMQSVCVESAEHVFYKKRDP